MASSNTAAYQLPSDAVWFITGCSSGIGRALAEHISSCGSYRLVATARNISSLSYLPDDFPSKILKLALDVSSLPSITSAVQTAAAHFSRLDVVVNNAGYSLCGDTEAASDSSARQLMDTNFWGVVNLTKLAIGTMRDTNPLSGSIGGIIMNVTSMGGRVALASQAFYHASKFAVEGFTESLANELRPEWGIHFTLIEPGGVKTSYAGTSLKRIAPPHPAYAKADSPSRVIEGYMLDPAATKYWAEPEEVARAMVNVVSNGQKIPLRVPLGPDAWVFLKGANEADAKELEKMKEVAFSVGKKEQVETLGFLAK
ncbi:short-chain dehydrogenase/reductase-like protein SDR [Podospora didyma]|uniref:Short-chain dehydrogenase/reductase-like protein SDR n=1 Tax=Podospora didyma TaxID=330526 RepID=A0AAE0NX26_9PEZI|nr:short-chain dehydrogenase/reductase-like protein SDR [Podospora didyma]